MNSFLLKIVKRSFKENQGRSTEESMRSHVELHEISSFDRSQKIFGSWEMIDPNKMGTLTILALHN